MLGEGSGAGGAVLGGREEGGAEGRGGGAFTLSPSRSFSTPVGGTEEGCGGSVCSSKALSTNRFMHKF